MKIKERMKELQEEQKLNLKFLKSNLKQEDYLMVHYYAELIMISELLLCELKEVKK